MHSFSTFPWILSGPGAFELFIFFNMLMILFSVIWISPSTVFVCLSISGILFKSSVNTPEKNLFSTSAFPRSSLIVCPSSMMTSSNGNISRVTGPLCGEFTGPGEFPTQRPVTWSFDVFFDLRVNKRLSKQPWGWWFETPSWSLWHHCNASLIKSGMWLEVLEFLFTWLQKVFGSFFTSCTILFSYSVLAMATSSVTLFLFVVYSVHFRSMSSLLLNFLLLLYWSHAFLSILIADSISLLDQGGLWVFVIFFSWGYFVLWVLRFYPEIDPLSAVHFYFWKFLPNFHF